MISCIGEVLCTNAYRKAYHTARIVGDTNRLYKKVGIDMRVHVTKRGDTLWNLAQRYHTTVGAIQYLNGIPSSLIVPGIALVIPSRQSYIVRQYTVKSGDSLWSIANNFRVPLTDLRDFNMPFPNQRLSSGQTILIPVAITEKPRIESNAYLVVSGKERDLDLVRQYESMLTDVSVFSYRMKPTGELVKPVFFLPPVPGIRYWMVVSNATKEGDFSADLAHHIFTDGSALQRLIDEILDELGDRQWAGISLDVEHVNPSDRQLLSAFVQKVTQALHGKGYQVAMAMPPKSFDDPQNPWVGAVDYAVLGKLVDRVMLMTYDWGYPAGTPMAVAPVDKVRGVLNYALSQMDSRKVLLGMPLYGDDWPLPHLPTKPATLMDNQSLLLRALQYEAEIAIDPVSVAPVYTYEHEGQRIVWFNDALSTLAKNALVREYNMRGFFYWELGFDFPQNWELLTDGFTIDHT